MEDLAPARTVLTVLIRFRIGPFAFEVDHAKADFNLQRHQVSVWSAATSFLDPFAHVEFDREHALDEDRWINVGSASDGRLLVTAYTLRGDRIRIISCRTADRRERHDFETRHV